jgi:hypothetical protein
MKSTININLNMPLKRVPVYNIYNINNINNIKAKANI